MPSTSALGTSLISADIPRSAAHLLYLLIQLLVDSVVFRLLFKSCKYFSSFSLVCLNSDLVEGPAAASFVDTSSRNRRSKMEGSKNSSRAYQYPLSTSVATVLHTHAQ